MTERFVVAGASVVDGTGAAAAVADVYVADAWIERIGPATDNHGALRVIDVTGLTLTPGFIDAHSHADNAPFLEQHDTTKILQGVTTEVVGNCGLSLAPRVPQRAELLSELSRRFTPTVAWSGNSLTEFLAEADRHGYVTNYAPLVGHGALRIAAMGTAGRECTSAELEVMGTLLDAALEAGAFGLSTGLIYPPGMFSTTEELVALARHLPKDRLYASHVRDEGNHLEASIREAILIGEEAACRVEISHHKAAGKQNWGKTVQSLRLMEEARARGLEIDADVYPYTAGSTSLSSTLPPSYQDASDDEILRRLQDPASLCRLREEIEEGPDDWENFAIHAGWDGILVSSTPSHNFEGRTIAELSEELGLNNVETLARVLVSEGLQTSMVTFMMSDEDLERVLADEHTMIGSDGLPPGMGGKPHPRLHGTFPRVLGRYVREKRVLGLEQAVRKMTSQPARKFRIDDRGVLAPGMVADMVAFDASEVGDVGDYGDPVHPPRGIHWVMQAGEMVVRDGQFLGQRRGIRLAPPH